MIADVSYDEIILINIKIQLFYRTHIHSVLPQPLCSFHLTDHQVVNMTPVSLDSSLVAHRPYLQTTLLWWPPVWDKRIWSPSDTAVLYVLVWTHTCTPGLNNRLWVRSCMRLHFYWLRHDLGKFSDVQVMKDTLKHTSSLCIMRDIFWTFLC